MTLIIIIFVVGFIVGMVYPQKRLKKSADQNKKWAEFYEILIKWLEVHNNNRKLDRFFIERGIFRIGIYGVKEIGNSLLKELENTKVKVVFLVDRNAENINSKITVYKPDEEFPAVDAIIVTAIHDYDNIEELLSQKVKCPIISIEDVVWEG